jgi:hypothetical protein
VTLADLVANKHRRKTILINLKDDLFRRNRFNLECQTNDDLPYVLKCGTEGSLITGADYSRADQPAEIEALDVIEQGGENPASVVHKILDDTPRRFWKLSVSS